MQKKKPRTKRRKKQTIVKSLSAALDKTNQILKNRFSVEHINYVTDNGIIKNGWLISSVEAIPEAVKLLRAQRASVYILGEFASAVTGWDRGKNTIVGSLWINGKQIEDITKPTDEEIKDSLNRWFSICIKGE